LYCQQLVNKLQLMNPLSASFVRRVEACRALTTGINKPYREVVGSILDQADFLLTRFLIELGSRRGASN